MCGCMYTLLSQCIILVYHYNEHDRGIIHSNIFVYYTCEVRWLPINSLPCWICLLSVNLWWTTKKKKQGEEGPVGSYIRVSVYVYVYLWKGLATYLFWLRNLDRSIAVLSFKWDQSFRLFFRYRPRNFYPLSLLNGWNILVFILKKIYF